MQGLEMHRINLLKQTQNLEQTVPHTLESNDRFHLQIEQTQAELETAQATISEIENSKFCQTLDAFHAFSAKKVYSLLADR